MLRVDFSYFPKRILEGSSDRLHHIATYRRSSPAREPIIDVQHKMMKTLVVLALLGCAIAQPFAPGQGVGPLGGFRTADAGGPYNLTLLSTQANEVAQGGAARGNFTDADIVDFITNVECLEGQFDTYGAFGRGFVGDLSKGGPAPIGVRKANVSAANLPYAQEVALNEQGHALFARQAGGRYPCPAIDILGGFNTFLARAYGLNGTVEQTYGAAFDPFLNDQNFFLSVLTLEELGATGNKGLAGIISNPVIANGVAGLATSATAQATIERFVLWTLRDTIVEPFNETVTQVFARVVALRNALSGPTLIDQGLVNTDPRFIAVPDQFVNLIPTDIRGLTLNRTPQQIINVLTIGNGSVGGFLPEGLRGALNSSAGLTDMGNGFADAPTGVVGQESAESVGTIMPPLNGSTPATVPGVYALSQAVDGLRANDSFITRGYFVPVGAQAPAYGPAATVVELPIVPPSTSSATAGK